VAAAESVSLCVPMKRDGVCGSGMRRDSRMLETSDFQHYRPRVKVGCFGFIAVSSRIILAA
jgi:hypothetical protein